MCYIFHTLFIIFNGLFFSFFLFFKCLHVNQQNENEQNTDDSRTEVSNVIYYMQTIVRVNEAITQTKNKKLFKYINKREKKTEFCDKSQPHYFYSLMPHTHYTANKFIQHYSIIIQFQFALLSSHSSQATTTTTSTVEAATEKKEHTICHLIPFVSCISFKFELSINFS